MVCSSALAACYWRPVWHVKHRRGAPGLNKQQVSGPASHLALSCCSAGPASRETNMLVTNGQAPSAAPYVHQALQLRDGVCQSWEVPLLHYFLKTYRNCNGYGVQCTQPQLVQHTRYSRCQPVLVVDCNHLQEPPSCSAIWDSNSQQCM